MKRTEQTYCQKLKTPPLFTTLRVNTLQISAADAKQKLQQHVEEQYKSRQEAAPVVTEHDVLTDVLVIAGRGPLLREKHEKVVIVDHACGCAVLRGAHVFTHGILAAPFNMCAGDFVSVYADIDGSCLMGATKPYTGQTVHVGNGIAKISRADIFLTPNKPGGVGIEMVAPIYDAPSLSGVLPELLFPQNVPSAVVGHVLSPEPGECILDMCAAPGGKTTHIATRMKNQGRVIAFDKSAGKIAKISEHCAAWNISIVEAYACDARRCIETDAVPDGGPPYPEEMFDRVLLDGPCSALGQRPKLVCKMTRNHLASHPALQKQIFAQAVRALKPGGCLVYSTCTITTAENEEIVAWALNTFPQLKLAKQTPHLGGYGLQVDGLAEEQAQWLQRFGTACLTTAENQTDILNDILSNNTGDFNEEVYHANETDERYNVDVNEDTIGFFIAKFMKS